MRVVRLGTTDLRVSAICLGTGAFGGDWGDVDEEEAKRTMVAGVVPLPGPSPEGM